jgi:hypothetical protein
MNTARRLAVLVLLASAGPAPAGAQVTVSGEATATIGARDDTAFFNYTDYEHNALRMFRVSLSGMWRPVSRIAFLTELRSEDAQRVIPYALYVRVRPWAGRAFDIQAGRIPPVFGAFGRRTYGASENPLIGYPLAYQYLTSLRSDAIPASADDLLDMRARGWQASYPIGAPDEAPGVPLVTAYRWDTGVQAHGVAGRFAASVAVTVGTLSNPRVEDDNRGRQVSGRIGWMPIAGLAVGASAARGEFLTRSIGDASEAIFGTRSSGLRALGVDAEYSRDHWIVRGEVIDNRWELPTFGQPVIATPLRATAAFVETRYRFTPRYFAAARADRLTFSRIKGELNFQGRPTPWDAPVTRIEVGGGVQILRNLEARAVVQRNWRDAGRVRDRTFLSGQVAVWF